MKCIQCNKDSTFPQRAARTCPHCNHKFAFELRQGDLLTDAAFKAAIDRVSSNGRIKFGVEHVYYEVCRRLWRKRGKGLIQATAVPSVILLIPAISVAWNVGPWWPVVLLLAIMPLGAIVPRSKARLLEPEAFGELWKLYTEAHGTPKGTIARLDARAPAIESDLGDYSFDRAVICDRARTVDLLLANQFHFENSCAVLAFPGYPQAIFQTVRRMLQRNPKLRVYVLHDATIDGCALAARLREDPEWFGGRPGVTVTDVGLRPKSAGRLRGMHGVAHEIIDHHAVTAKEAKFLSQFSVELAAIRPQRTLKVLFRAMNPKPHAEDEIEDLVEIDLPVGADGDGGDGGDSSDGGDGASDDWGADSFG